MPQQHLIEAFAAHLETERRASRHTVLSYRRDLQKLNAYLDARLIDRWSEVQPVMARGFAGESYRQRLSGRSIARMLSASRSFYRYLIREGQAQGNPFEGVTAPKSARKLPSILTADQAIKLVDIPGDDTLAVRDKAIVELFYSSGLRLQELVGLDLTDVNLQEGIMRVLGKGSKTRLLPVGSHAVSAMKRWLTRRPSWAKDSETAFFVTQRGGRPTTRTIQQRIKFRAMEQGISVAVHPHMLRHSFATHVLESSGDVRAVQELLGHSSMSSTQIYTHLDFGHLSKVYDQAHPRAKRRASK